jgi:cytochrome b pre-mRNA-processing protein 3
MAWFSSRTADDRKATDLYGAVVAAARRPNFFADCGIPDTPEGRYEVLVLHLFLAVERLKAAGAGGVELARLVLEAFVVDMDDNMREMGVGDLTVPKKVKRAAAAFYERAGAYRAGVAAASTETMRAALVRFIPELAQHPKGSEAIAEYVREASVRLVAQLDREVLAGKIAMPDMRAAGSSGSGGAA